MYPWRRTDSNRYWCFYKDIIDNFEKSCRVKYPNQSILFLDNTYQNLNQVTDIVKEQSCDVNFIFSLVDPPYPWNYLKEQLTLNFPDKKFIFVGNDHAPDFEINSGFIWFYKNLQKYSDDEILITKVDYTFLNYNYKSHNHRTKLIDLMTDQNLIECGYTSYPRTPENFKHFESHSFTLSLGDIKIWQTHFLNIVSETVFRLKSEPLMITEKVFKPVLGLRPFIINGTTRYYHELRTMGFDCFEDIFPVRELEIELDTLDATMDKNHQIICDVIKDLQHKNLPELYQQLLPRLIANRNHWEKLCQDLTKKFCVDPIELP